MAPDEIKRNRLRAGLTQSEMARSLNVAQATVAHWESGLRIPTDTTVAILNRWAERLDQKDREAFIRSMKLHAVVGGIAITLRLLFKDSSPPTD